MATLNLTKTPIGVPQELQSAFSDVYNALWTLHASQASAADNAPTLVQGTGISIRVEGNTYVISNSGVSRVIPVGAGYELLAPTSDSGVYNLITLLAGDNIQMSLDKEKGLTVSANLEKVYWDSIVDAPATYPPSVHSHALSDVVLYRRGSSSFKTISDYFDSIYNSSLLAGGQITLNADCTISVAAGSCLIRETADNSGHLYVYDFSATNLAAIVAGATKQVVLVQALTTNGDGTVSRNVTVQLADIANNSNILSLATVTNINGKLHFLAVNPSSAGLLNTIITKDRSVSPVAIEASSGFKLTTGVSRTLQVEAGALWASMSRYTHAYRDTAVKAITEVYGAHFGLTLSSWPNANYYNTSTDSLAAITAGKYGCLWIYSSIDTDDWFVAYGTAQFDSATAAAASQAPSYLSAQFTSSSFLLGRLIFLAGADSPFDLETATNFKVTGTTAKFADLVNSYASLVNGKVPESQLPSYVDDVLEYEDDTKFPAVGERGKIYVDCLNNATYRWTGTTYVKIGDGSSTPLASTDALAEGTVNKYYTDARARAALRASGDLAYNPTTGAFSYTAPAKEPPIAAGTSAQYWRGDKTWQTLNKAAVGLSNVDNTADANKNVLYATTAGSAPASDVPSWAKAATKPTYTTAEVGLGNVNNTSDADKPLSTAATTALAGKEPTIVAGTAAQYWAGNKSWTDFATSARAVVLTGLSTATNAVIVATDSVLAAFGKLQKQVSDNLTALITHTTSSSNPHNVTKAQVGLGNVDNTADANKSVSSAATATKVQATATGTNSATLISAGMADNDRFRILVGGTASNAGYAEIATADDGTEPIYVRQYTGVFASVARTLTLLDESGNTTIPGTVSISGVAKALAGVDILGNGDNGVFPTGSNSSSFTANNVAIKSWWGIGFAPSCSGQTIPTGQYSHYFDTRSGNAGFAGSLETGALWVKNGNDINIQATPGSTDSGDILFRIGDGTIKHRLNHDIADSADSLIYRHNEGNAYKLMHFGNYNQVALPNDGSQSLNGILGINALSPTGDINGQATFCFSRSRTGADQYLKIATLPASTTSTRDHIVISGVFDDNWDSLQKTRYEIIMSNRNSFHSHYQLFGSAHTGSVIKAYQETDGSVSVWAATLGTSWSTLNLNITHAVGCTIYKDGIAGTPTGNLVFDSTDTTTYPPQFWVGLNSSTLKSYGKDILHSGNFNSYSPTLTGGGASGTWNINVLGYSQGVQAVSDTGIKNTQSLAAAANTWAARNISVNPTVDRAVFTGIWSGSAAVAAHNASLGAWAPLYVNTVSGQSGGAVYLGQNANVMDSSGRAWPILHQGNFINYTVNLTNGVAPDYSGQDLNALSKAGFYRGYNFTNAPEGNTGWYWITVQGHDNKGEADGWISQTAISYGLGNTANRMWTRVKVGNLWTGWFEHVTSNGAVAAQQAWQDITLPSYWTLDNAEDKPQYMKDLFGFVHMRGRVATSGNGTVTLPAGYRPAAFTWIGGKSNTLPGYGGGIGSNGVINWIDSTTSYIIFDNVCFRAA